jgi:CxxC-x17-CxxC domain-containing protein
MFQGNWTCSKCGGEIKELPFEPRGTSGLTCRDCFMKGKNNSAPAPEPVAGEVDDREAPPFDPDESTAASEPAPESPEMATAPAASTEKKMFEGDWSCSVCGGAIASLPFEPRSTEGLKCIDCFKKG